MVLAAGFLGSLSAMLIQGRSGESAVRNNLARWLRRRLAKATEWPKRERKPSTQSSSILALTIGAGIATRGDALRASGRRIGSPGSLGAGHAQG